MSIKIKTDKIQAGKFQWFYRQTELENDQSEEKTNLRTPILFLHGLPAHSYTWRQIMSILADEDIPSIAPDWIGCGFSDQPNQRDFDYTPEAFLTGLRELVEALKLEKFYLVVQGFLGSVGLQYALQHSEQIEGLIILNTPISDNAKLPWLMKQLTIPFVGDMMTQDPLVVDRTLEKGSGFIITDQDLGVLRKPFLESSAAGRSLMAILKKMQLNKSMKEIETGLSQWSKPTLILWGLRDSWLDVADAKKLAAANSEITLVELAEAKHYPQEHWSSEISTEILQFFRRKVF